MLCHVSTACGQIGTANDMATLYTCIAFSLSNRHCNSFSFPVLSLLFTSPLKTCHQQRRQHSNIHTASPIELNLRHRSSKAQHQPALLFCTSAVTSASSLVSSPPPPSWHLFNRLPCPASVSRLRQPCAPLLPRQAQLSLPP